MWLHHDKASSHYFSLWSERNELYGASHVQV